MHEYPKMLYKGGAAYDDQGRRSTDTVTVRNITEEESAQADGYAESSTLKQAVDFLAGPSPEPPAGSATDSDPAHMLVAGGAPAPDAIPGPPDPNPFDHDGDGKPGGAPKGGNRRKKKQA